MFVVLVYPNSRSTEIRSRLQLRGTVPGAFNRLDIESIVSYDHEGGLQQVWMWGMGTQCATHQASQPVVSYEHEEGLQAGLAVWT